MSAVLRTRRVLPTYGGSEAFVEELGAALAIRGQMTVD